MNLAEVADVLYSLPHAEFTAARADYVKAAKADGERELSATIGKLRRPTSAAWLVNQLAREQPAELTRLADLGDRLRAAHHDVDGGAIRELSRERRTVMGSLVAASRDVGRDHGQPVGDPVVRELEEMFTAALADADAATALASGRLTSAKDLVNGVRSWPESDARPQRLTRPAKHARGETPQDPTEPPGDEPAKVTDLAAARRAKARAELERLESELVAAARAGEQARSAADDATDEETDARKAVTRLRTELSHAEHTEKEAREQARAARRAHEDAERTVRDTRKRRDVAASRLAALGDAT